jgi:hypothetical protein
VIEFMTNNIHSSNVGEMSDRESPSTRTETNKGGTTGDSAQKMTSDGVDDESEDGGSLVNRRTVLAGTLLGGLGLGAGAYAVIDRDEEKNEQQIPADHVPFTVWEELQAELHTSPDHLPARADVLVEGGDLEAIFEFVRDEIGTVPTHVDGISPGSNARTPDEVVRWGSRGALRCGMGTPRDKAELLVDLYREAGYESRLQSVNINPSEEEVKAQLLQSRERTFDPDIDGETISDWQERLEHEEALELTVIGEETISLIENVSGFTRIDEEGHKAEALVASLREVLPEDPSDDHRGADDFDWRWDGRSPSPAPIVAVSTDDGEQYANLFSDVRFGELGSDETPSDAPDPEIDTVSVTLSASTPQTLDEPFDLVSGEWTVPDLIGRQVLVRTPPVVGLFEHPEVAIGDLDTFVPTLVLQDVRLSAEAMAEQTAFGDGFGLNGDRLSVDHLIDGDDLSSDGVVMRNDKPLYDPNVERDPSTVVSLDVTANASDYPRIRLEATATDEDGDHVDGLTGSAFAVTDNNESVTPTLVGNAPEPHVLFVRDVSGSMDVYGVDEADDDDWFDDLRSVIEETVPNVDLEVRDVDSAIWTHLTEAVADSPDLLVYAHDGRPTDDHVQSMNSILEHAPPTVLLSATDGEEPIEDAIVLEQAELTGGETAPMGDRDVVKSAVVTALEALDVPTYRFDYHVPDNEQGSRTVELQVGEDPVKSPSAEASTKYETIEDNPIVSTLVGLYLTIEMGDRSVTRTLAGHDPVLEGGWDPYRDDPDSETGIGLPNARAHADDVQNAVLGGVTLSFEGDGVPFSVAVDDYLEAVRTRQHFEVASVEGEFEDAREAWERGFVDIPWEELLIHAPLPQASSEQGLTFFDGPRVAVHQTKPIRGEDQVDIEESVDVVPLSRVSTAAIDPADRFWLTLERTAQIAVIEERAYERSTKSMLDEIGLSELSNLSDHGVESDRRDQYQELRDRAGFSRNDFQLCPSDGSELAFWNVDRETGALLGVLPDGTGGGKRVSDTPQYSCAAGLVELILKGLRKAGALSAGGAVALGVVAAYYAQLAELYAGVAIVLAHARQGLDLNNDLRNQMRDIPGNVLADVLPGPSEPGGC